MSVKAEWIVVRSAQVTWYATTREGMQMVVRTKSRGIGSCGSSSSTPMWSGCPHSSGLAHPEMAASSSLLSPWWSWPSDTDHSGVPRRCPAVFSHGARQWRWHHTKALVVCLLSLVMSAQSPPFSSLSTTGERAETIAIPSVCSKNWSWNWKYVDLGRALSRSAPVVVTSVFVRTGTH